MCLCIVHSTRRAGARRGAETFVKMEGGGEYPCHREKCRCNWQLAPFLLNNLATEFAKKIELFFFSFSLNNLAAEFAKEIELGQKLLSAIL